MFVRSLMKEQYGVALIPSTKDAMAAEKTAKENGLSLRIIPTPGQIQSTCGFSLRFSLDDRQRLAAMLQELSISCEGMYRAEQCGLHVTYERI